MDISYFDQTCQVLLNCENGKMQNKYPPAFIKSNTFVKINTREMSNVFNPANWHEGKLFL